MQESSARPAHRHHRDSRNLYAPLHRRRSCAHRTSSLPNSARRCRSRRQHHEKIAFWGRTSGGVNRRSDGNDLIASGFPARPSPRVVCHVSRWPPSANLLARASEVLHAGFFYLDGRLCRWHPRWITGHRHARRSFQYRHAVCLRASRSRRANPSLPGAGPPPRLPRPWRPAGAHRDHPHVHSTHGRAADYELDSLFCLDGHRPGDLLQLRPEAQHTPGSQRRVKESRCVRDSLEKWRFGQAFCSRARLFLCCSRSPPLLGGVTPTSWSSTKPSTRCLKIFVASLNPTEGFFSCTSSTLWMPWQKLPPKSATTIFISTSTAASPSMPFLAVTKRRWPNTENQSWRPMVFCPGRLGFTARN